MVGKQSWESCKHHLGDLEINIKSILDTRSEFRLMRAIFPKTQDERSEEEIFRREGVNRWYYCTCLELINLNVYPRDGIPKKKEGYIPVVGLFHLDISDDLSTDWFGSERYRLESAIEDGLKMCAHCKFYKRK